MGFEIEVVPLQDRRTVTGTPAFSAMVRRVKAKVAVGDCRVSNLLSTGLF